jgi:1-acyl-sn-glycerol-3-phosphate acyltransferase
MFSTLTEFVRNILAWLYVLTSVPIIGLLAVLTKRHFFAWLWCHLLLKVLGIRIKVIAEKFPEKGKKYVFMANHQSQLDIPVLESLLKDYNIRFLAKKSLFDIPFFGWGIKALGYVPVEREDPKEGLKSLLACVDRLKEGVSLVVFPEGTRSKTGELLPFKAAGFLIPIKAGVPVCPVSIWGTFRILPKGSLWFNLKKREVWVSIGPVIEVKNLTLKDKNTLLSQVRENIEKSLERMKNL